MNVKDIKLDPTKIPWRKAERIVEGFSVPGGPNVADLLATIFEGQRQLMETYHGIEERNKAVVIEPERWGELDDREVQMRIKDLAYRMVEEVSEATNCLKQKPWKNSFVATDKDHFTEELADALHFFVEMLITSGLSAEDVFRVYYRKHAVNQFRQRSNY